MLTTWSWPRVVPVALASGRSSGLGLGSFQWPWPRVVPGASLWDPELRVPEMGSEPPCQSCLEFASRFGGKVMGSDVGWMESWSPCF